MRGKKWGKFLVENSQIWGKKRDFYMENDPTAGSQLHPEGLGEDVSGIPEILRHPGEAGSHRDLPQRLPGKSLLLKTGKKTLGKSRNSKVLHPHVLPGICSNPAPNFFLGKLRDLVPAIPRIPQNSSDIFSPQ